MKYFNRKIFYKKIQKLSFPTLISINLGSNHLGVSLGRGLDCAAGFGTTRVDDLRPLASMSIEMDVVAFILGFLVPKVRYRKNPSTGIYTISLIDGMRRSGLFKNCFFTLVDEYMRKKMAEACMLRHYPEIVGNLQKKQLLLNNLTSFFVLESAFEGEHVHDFEVGDSFLLREEYMESFGKGFQ
ncbi:hypothetical protein Q3G72_015003 [Acer saccharum]|nr:hypothetical protein Q3G72_015003 [Acer saccharum]